MQKKIDQILTKGKMGNAKENEKKEMFALFHQAENEYELKGKLLEELENSENMDASSTFFNNTFSKIWSKIEKLEVEPKSKTKFINTFSRIAAIVIIGLLAGFYITSVKNANQAVYYEAYSPEGSVSEMTLPDGSVIFLNAGSRIKYSFSGENGMREVFLNGEAWFDVNKNKNKTFVVHTPYYDVKVTGTQFNVKAYEADSKVTTTLEEGAVYISSTENYRLENDVKLVPGEQVVFDIETKEISIKTVNTKWFTSWKENKLIFVNMSLQELIVLLERKYGVNIVVKNNDLLNLHFDGTIKNETIIEILEIIKKTLPVNYNITGQKIEITAK